MKISKRDVFIFILAGGKGTRFWPLSRKNTPKQFLPLFNSQSMLQKTYLRFKRYVPSKQIYIITPSSQIKHIKKQLSDFDRKNFIIEPIARGTAAAIGLAAISIRRKRPESLMIVVPADQYAKGEREFRKVLNKATLAASFSDNLVTIGIKPTFASTGYGYLKIGKRLKIKSCYVNKIDKFIEKPSIDKALKYVKSNKYYFNSGMFIWKVNTFLNGLKKYMPNLYKNLLRIERIDKLHYKEKLKKIGSIYNKLKPITIDYGFMQKANNIIVIKADFQWSDLGSLKSLEDIKTKDTNSNIIAGALSIRQDTKDCIIYGESGHLITTVGISKLIIVQTPNITLIVHKDDTQKIKDLVNKISKNKKFKKFI